MQRIHVYDLDGVLVDSSHRYRNTPEGALDLAHWKANRTPSKIALDTLLPHSWQYMNDVLDPDTFVILCTSRERTLIDLEYIENVLGQPDRLIMRPSGNGEADTVLKLRQLQRVLKLKKFHGLPRVLFEDNTHNINALRHLFDKCVYVLSNQGA